MATVTAAEHSEQRARVEPIAQRTQRAESRRVSIDVNLATLIAVGALAITAFTYLNIRIDNVATELRGEIRGVNERIEKVTTEMRGEMKRYSERTDDKIDRLTEKINELLVAQSRGK